jgi:hypothetical protein
MESKYKNGTEMLEWIDEREPSSWCRSLFGIARYGVKTSNTVEIVFNTLNKVRGYSYLELLMFIEKYGLKKYEAYVKAKNMERPLTNPAYKLFVKESKRMGQMSSDMIGTSTAIVTYERGTLRKEYLVDLKKNMFVWILARASCAMITYYESYNI